jgi:hypothetical protein
LLQICAQSGGELFYWNPQGAPALCLAFDGQDCTQCVEGYVVDNNRCVLLANFFHLTFNGNLYDLSPNNRQVLLGNTPDQFTFATVRWFESHMS